MEKLKVEALASVRDGTLSIFLTFLTREAARHYILQSHDTLYCAVGSLQVQTSLCLLDLVAHDGRNPNNI